MMETLPMPLAQISQASGSLDEFRVHAPAEINALLKRFLDGNVLLTLSEPHGVSYTTTLWALDAARGVVSFAAGDDLRVHQLVESDEVSAVGYLDSIKVQFEARGLSRVSGRSGSALTAAFPHELFRFQRRAAFRVRPVGRPAPQARVSHPALNETEVVLRVLDVSVSGVALFIGTDLPEIRPGTRLRDAQIDLDADTRLTVDLRVHHVTVLNPEARGARLGCELIDLGGDARRALQLFIDATQKRQRLFLSQG
jgi:flagellar brake protein